jgi:outer membrane beta-barrel protein
MAFAFQPLQRNRERKPMRKRQSLRVILITFILFCVPLSAHADDPAVVKQLYDLSGRFEIILTPSMSVFDKYTRHVGTSLGLAYFLNDYIGFEVEGGYAFISNDRKLLDEVLKTSTEMSDWDTDKQIEKLPLTDLKRMSWWASGGIVVSPLYGKLNFSSELAISIHLFFTAGGGVADYWYSRLNHIEDRCRKGDSSCLLGIERESIQYLEKECEDDSNFNCYLKMKKKNYHQGTKPIFYVGGGLLFHITHSWTLRLEIRDVFFYDEYTADFKESGLNTTPKKIEDFVHNTFLRIGVGYAF